MNADRRLEVIPLDKIEAEAEFVRRELDRLLDRARDEYRAIQDVEVERDGAEPGRYWTRMYVARDELAGIARQLTRAGAGLIHSSDRRFTASQQVIGYCNEADDAARFPRAAA